MTVAATGPLHPSVSERCPVTVVGSRRRVDLSLPLDTPIGEYIGLLMEFCGQASNETLPEVWSLAPLGQRPLPVQASLRACEPYEGMVLYLRDVAAGEADEPVVVDIEEVVRESTDAMGRLRWNQRAAAVTLLVVGGGWLVALVGLFLLGPHRTAAAALSAVVAFALPVLAAIGRYRRWPAPDAVWPALALAAPPCLAAAAWLITGSTAAAMAGGCAGGLVALVTVPSVLTLGASLWLSVAAIVAVPLTLAAASLPRVAAVVALAGYAMSLLGPTAAARLALTRLASPPTGGRPDAGEGQEPATMAEAIHRAHLILGAWAAAAALVTVTGLVLLARATQPYGWALALALSLALVLHAVSYTFLIEAAAAIATAAAGLVTLAASVPQWLHWPAWSMLGAALPAVVAVTVGGWLVRRSPFPDRRPDWLSGLALTASILAVLAALAVWGLPDLLLRIGGSLA